MLVIVFSPMSQSYNEVSSLACFSARVDLREVTKNLRFRLIYKLNLSSIYSRGSGVLHPTLAIQPCINVMNIYPLCIYTKKKINLCVQFSEGKTFGVTCKGLSSSMDPRVL